MTKLNLTPAQKRFLARFDSHTMHGAIPRETRRLREEWKIQDRTVNTCRRLGLLKKVGSTTEEFLFIVNPNKRDLLGLDCFNPTERRIRKRSSFFG